MANLGRVSILSQPILLNVALLLSPSHVLFFESGISILRAPKIKKGENVTEPMIEAGSKVFGELEGFKDGKKLRDLLSLDELKDGKKLGGLQEKDEIEDSQEL